MPGTPNKKAKVEIISYIDVRRCLTKLEADEFFLNYVLQTHARKIPCIHEQDKHMQIKHIGPPWIYIKMIAMSN